MMDENIQFWLDLASAFLVMACILFFVGAWLGVIVGRRLERRARARANAIAKMAQAVGVR